MTYTKLIKEKRLILIYKEIRSFRYVAKELFDGEKEVQNNWAITTKLDHDVTEIKCQGEECLITTSSVQTQISKVNIDAEKSKISFTLEERYYIYKGYNIFGSFFNEDYIILSGFEMIWPEFQEEQKAFRRRDQRGLLVFKRSKLEGYGEILTGIGEREFETPVNQETSFLISKTENGEYLLVKDSSNRLSKFKKTQPGIKIGKSKIDLVEIDIRIGYKDAISLNQIFKGKSGISLTMIIMLVVIFVLFLAVIFFILKSRNGKEKEDSFSRVGDNYSFDAGKTMSELESGDGDLDDEAGLVNKRKFD